MRLPNRSHAVRSQRIEAADSPDDFPTPPWATRALIEHVLKDGTALAQMTCLEPACGSGHMAEALQPNFREVTCSDAYDYGYGAVRDFLKDPYPDAAFDWIVTNPPFRLAEEFIHEARRVTRVGVAILARTVFLEGNGRHQRLFRTAAPHVVAQFVERVPMVKGKLDPKVSTATGYAWFVWHLGKPAASTQLRWIPRCRRELESATDYPPPPNAA